MGNIPEIVKVLKEEEKQGAFNSGTLSSVKSDSNAVEIEENLSKNLAESEKLFRTLVEQSTIGVYIHDPVANKVLYVNPLIKKILKINDDLKDVDFFKYVHPDDTELIKQRTKKRLAGENIDPCVEVRLFPPNGQMMWIKLYTTYITYKGKTAALASVIDITNEKLYNTEIQESQVRYKSLFDSSQDAIMTIEPPTWKFTSGNNSALRIFGIKTEKEFTELGPWDVAPEFQPDGKPSNDKAKEMINNAMQNGSNFFEWTHKKINGKSFPTTVLLTKVTIGKKEFLQATVRDITEQKKTLDTLQQSKEHYRALFESSADGILIADITTRVFSDANTAICNLLGYTKDELCGMSVQDIHPKESLGYVFSEFEAQSKGEKTLAKNIPCLRKNGSIVYSDVNTTVTLIDGRKCNIGFFRDITKQKENEKEIETILNATADGIRIVGMDYKIKSLNKTMAELAGIKQQNVIGLKCKDVFRSEFCETEECAIKKILKKGESYQQEQKMYTKDGKLVHCLVSVSPYKDGNGNIVGVIEDYRDISYILETKQELNDREELFRTITSSAQDGIIMIDNNANVSYWNSAAEKIFGYKKEEIMGKNMHMILAPENYHNDYRKGFEKFKETGTGAAVGNTLELKAKRKNGEIFSIELSMSSVKVKNKWSAVGIVRDITYRKESEKTLKEKIEELERYKKITVDRELKMMDLKKKIKMFEATEG